MSTFQIWMTWVISVMVVLDIFCVVGYSKRKREQAEQTEQDKTKN